MVATGQIEAGRAYGRTRRSRCLVKAREHRDDIPPAVVVVLVVAELPRLAFHEGEQSDRVARVEPTQTLTAARGDRRDHELQATVPESDGGVEGAP